MKGICRDVVGDRLHSTFGWVRESCEGTESGGAL